MAVLVFVVDNPVVMSRANSLSMLLICFGSNRGSITSTTGNSGSNGGSDSNGGSGSNGNPGILILPYFSEIVHKVGTTLLL